MIEGGPELAIDNWPILVSHERRQQSFDLVKTIGWSAELCTRAGLEAVRTPVVREPVAAIGRRSPDLPQTSSSGFQTEQGTTSEGSQYSPLSTDAVTVTCGAGHASPPYQSVLSSPRSDSVSMTSSQRQQLLFSSTQSSHHLSQSPSLQSFVPSSSAAAEKQRLHDAAIAQRDQTQAKIAAEAERYHQQQQQHHHSMLRGQDRRQSYQLRDEPKGPVTESPPPVPPAQSAHSEQPHSPFSPTATELEPATLHQASVVPAPSPVPTPDPMLLLRSALSKAPQDRTAGEHAAVDRLLSGQVESSRLMNPVLASPVGPGAITRSSTTVARSGSILDSGTEIGTSAIGSSKIAASTETPRLPVTSTFPPNVSSSSSFELLRSKTKMTSAEQEKRMLFESARETAQKRQNEARLELERQSRALEDMQRIEEELERMREAELAQRDEIEKRLKEEAEAEEHRWQREEEERQRKAKAEFEERARLNQLKREEELRRLAAVQRDREEDNKQLMLQRRREQDRMELQRMEETRQREAEERSRQRMDQDRLEREAAAEEQARQAREIQRQSELAREGFKAQQERLHQQSQQTFGTAASHPVAGASASFTGVPNVLQGDESSSSTSRYVPSIVNGKLTTQCLYANRAILTLDCQVSSSRASHQKCQTTIKVSDSARTWLATARSRPLRLPPLWAKQT